MFSQKMEYNNEINQQTQALSNDIFAFKRQIESLGHTLEDLESENRRLKIELDGSRLKFTEQSSHYIYTEEDMYTLREEINEKYKKIMHLQN
jgi:regulator of replication initiation timing